MRISLSVWPLLASLYPASAGVLLLLSALSRDVGAQLAPKRGLATGAPQGCATLTVPGSSNVPSAGAEDQETRRLISAGQEASLQGEHTAARDAFAQAARRSPQSAQLAYYLGREHEFLASATDAVKEYCRYLQLSPAARDADEVQGRIVRLVPRSQLAQVDEAKANFSSGLALLDRRQFIAADSMFGSIAVRLPNAPEIYYNRALARAARGERGLATQDFQKYLDLSSNPSDRAAINAAVARLQDRVFGSGQAFGSGLVFPGMGQMSTGRPFIGVLVLGAVTGSLVWGMIQEEEARPVTYLDPFDRPYVDTLRLTTRPNLVLATAVAGTLWVGSALESLSYARRTRARAESIIQVVVPGTDDASAFLALGRGGIGAGVKIRLP